MGTHNDSAIGIMDGFREHVMLRFGKELEEACYGLYGLRHLMRLTRLGQLRAFCVVKDFEYIGMGFWEVVAYPTGRTHMRIVALAGEGLQDWLWAVENWADEICRTLALDGIEYCGRKGFKKLLRDQNVKELAYVLKEVKWDSGQEKP